MAELTTWREGSLVFDNRPLAAIVQEMNRYSTQKIRIEDAEAGGHAALRPLQDRRRRGLCRHAPGLWRGQGQRPPPLRRSTCARRRRVRICRNAAVLTQAAGAVPASGLEGTLMKMIYKALATSALCASAWMAAGSAWRRHDAGPAQRADRLGGRLYA